MSKKKVCIVGSGNWGSAIARIVGMNAEKEETFHNRVNMYVFEEMVNGEKLSEVINTRHENIKYLPGHIIPSNVVAVTDVIEASKDADILIFVLPHQFIRGICNQLAGKIKPTAIAVSLIKGIDASSGGIKLISDVIADILKINCSVLMGANLAPEVARENYCEATIGSKEASDGQLLKQCLQASYFRLVVVDDYNTVELCGALKNVVAVGAGVVDGLGYGDNTKAAVIRLGLMEMIKFIEVQYPGSKRDTFLESCGIADLITTCYGGRNRRVAEAMAKTGKTIAELEIEMLNGQSLQGPPTAAEINLVLKAKGEEERFPMFTAVHKMCTGEITCSDFIDCLKNHPEHM